MAPRGWTDVTLDEVVDEFRGGGTPSRKEPDYWDGEIAWASVKDLNGKQLHETLESITEAGLENSSAKIVPTDTVVLATRMAVGKAATAMIPVAINQDLKGVIPNARLRSDYLKMWLNWREEAILALASGTTVKGIRLSTLRSLSMSLPPVSEQKKVAAILSRVDDAIAPTRKVIEQSKRVKKGLLQDLMTRGIGHTRFKQTEIGKIPEEWGVVDLPTLGAGDRPMVKAGPFGSALKKEYYTDSGYKIYGQEQVLEGDAAFGDYYVDEEKYRELETCAVQPGDVLVTLVGTPGKTLVLGENIQDGVINPRLVRLSPDPNLVHPRFLSLYLESPLARKRLARLSQGGTMDILNSKMLSSLEVPRPRVEEQQEIMEALDTVDESVLKCQEAVIGLETLRRGLMQDLLTGRVRVSVD